MGQQQTKEAIEKAKVEKEKKTIRAAINRQRYYEAFEIKQDWNFVFGTEKPKKRKDVLVIKDVTPRNVWMINRYIFEKIKEFRPDELFHSIDEYALKWTPPGSAHQMMVPLDDPQLQEMLIVKISFIPKKLQKRLLFFFAPRSLNMDMFAPKVHPASLVSYRLRNEVMQKLCSQYLEGRMDVQEFEAIVGGNYDLWKSAMFNMLPEDEQPYHTYLTEKPEVVKTLKMAEADYMAGLITLQDFYNIKFPERKKQKDLEALTYPLPQAPATCIVCLHPQNGIIKCTVCDNKICVACVHTHYLDPITREGSFLLFHRRQCLKLPLLKPLHPEAALEPAFLRELRATGQGHAMEILGPLIARKMQPEEEEEEEEEEEDDDEERRYEEEKRRREEEAERQRLLLECPPELEHLKHALQNRKKKLEKLKKEIMMHQGNLDQPGHTEMYEARQQRLRDEFIEKLEQNVAHPVSVILKSILHLNLASSETLKNIIADAELVIAQCRLMTEMTSVVDYEAKLQLFQEEADARRNEAKIKMAEHVAAAIAAAEARKSNDESPSASADESSPSVEASPLINVEDASPPAAVE